MSRWLREIFKKTEVVVADEPCAETTRLEDDVVAYFKSGHSDLVRLTEALGFKTQKALYEKIKDVRVKVMFLSKGTNQCPDLRTDNFYVGKEGKGVLCKIVKRGE